MTFLDWWQAGFTDIIPITAPGGRVSPTSSLKDRASELGKAPGMVNRNGEWRSFDWQTHEATVDQLAVWESWGANLGLRTRHYPAVDIDCTDPFLATVIENVARKCLGEAPTRGRSNSSKRTRLYVTAEPFKRMRLWLLLDGEHHLVEVLGDGQQFVIEGTHPTGVPFVWDQTEFDVGTLTEITLAEVEGFFTKLEEAATKLGYFCTREGKGKLAGVGEDIDQSNLAGPADQVLAAVRAIPNSNALFPGRDDYLRMGYAIKAALGDSGLACWLEWAGKWEGNERAVFSETVARQDWARMTPPYQVGAGWIFDLARNHGYTTADSVFADICEPAPFEPRASTGAMLSDAWLAARFLEEHQHEVRFCAALGGWMIWDGHRWVPDTLGRVLDWAGTTTRKAAKGAEKPERKRLGADKTRRAVVAHASTEADVAVGSEAFDRDPWLLNTPEGMVDLRNGVLVPSDPALLFTRCTAVAPAPGVPHRWLQFLKEVTSHDDDMVTYLQRLAGYSLTGSTREHVLAFLWGPGGNGKGVFLNTLVRLFGSYATVAPMDTFTASRFDRHPTELASLFGARLVTAQETQEGRSWDEAKVKSITGGDPIRARYMRQDFFTFQPQFKLLFAGNHKPEIQSLDDAMRRRFHLIPFIFKPTTTDPELAERLVEEWPQILQWALDGCGLWQRDGLAPPAGVIEATAAYFDEEDPAGQWQQENTAADGWTSTVDLYEDYRLWCQRQGIRAPTLKHFSQHLERRGLRKDLHAETRRSGFKGITLTSSLTFPVEQSTTLH